MTQTHLRSQSLPAFFDTIAPSRDYWRGKNSYYYRNLELLHRTFIPPLARVLEIGCGTGDLLWSLRPKYGVGIDASFEMIKRASQKYPKLTFSVMDAEHLNLTETFDYIILNNLIGYTEDIWQVFSKLQSVCTPKTRIIITNYNFFWQPFLSIGEFLKLKMPDRIQNWLPQGFTAHFLSLTGFEVIHSGKYLHLPFDLGIVGNWINRILSLMPLLWRFGVIEYSIVRPTFFFEKPFPDTSVSIIVPTHEEAGNVESIIDQIPKIGTKTELIFVDLPGNDGTAGRIKSLMKTYKGPLSLALVEQTVRSGKVGALRLGVKKATGKIILIYDADLTVPPGDLPKFYQALLTGKGELINGTRLVYPTEKGAMRFLNHIANTLFAWGFSWALHQHFSDTLCGTKGFWKEDFIEFEKTMTPLEQKDQYGDFYLLLGAYRRGKKIAEVPVRYKTRRYGDTKIDRFKNGLTFLAIFLEFVYREKLLRLAYSPRT